MIAREFPPDLGGIGHYVYYLSKKLLERGHKITVITRGSAGKTVKEVVDGINIFYVSFFPVYPFHLWVHGAFVNQLLKFLEPELSLVHLHSPITPAIKTSLPVITTVHTPMKIDARYHEIFDLKSLFEKVQSGFVYPPMELGLFKISRKITTVSRTVALELREYGLDPSKITVVKNGVDSQSFFPLKQKESDEKYVLYTGVLRARKGLFDLVQCASHVCKTRPNSKFIICGKGPFRKRIEMTVKKMGLEKQIIFLGYVSRDDLIDIYQNAAVQVVPSHYEGMPNVLLEGMSCGLPVVATNIGGNNEVIVSGMNGFLVPTKAPQIMAETILKLLNDGKLRKEIGEEARKTIEKYYTWDKIAANILEDYKKLLKDVF